MPKHLTSHANQLEREFKRLEQTRVKVERLYRTSKLTKHDVERVYEGLFMKAVVTFEAVLEEAFIGLLAGTVTYAKSRIKPRIKDISRATATKLVLGGHPYVEWLPIDRTLNRARIFLKDGLPFTVLTSRETNAFTQITAIRNAIAHPSENAQKKFKAQVLQGQNLIRAEQTPAGYLRSVFRSSPNSTRFENLSDLCVNVVRMICK